MRSTVSSPPSTQVNSSPRLAGPPSYIPPEAYQQNDEVQKLMRNRGQRSADRAAALLADAGFEVEVQISSGNPTEQLLKEAEDGQFDLVAVGSRGPGPFRRALLGSVSDQLVRHSCAALIGRRLAS